MEDGQLNNYNKAFTDTKKMYDPVWPWHGRLLLAIINHMWCVLPVRKDNGIQAQTPCLAILSLENLRKLLAGKPKANSL